MISSDGFHDRNHLLWGTISSLVDPKINPDQYRSFKRTPENNAIPPSPNLLGTSMLSLP